MNSKTAFDRDRRQFIEGAMKLGLFAALAASGVKPVIAEARPRKKGPYPLTRERHKAVVIGSGFGGAIAAYNLSQKGIETVVLERGRRWPVSPKGGTFARFYHPDRRAVWLSRTANFPHAMPFIDRRYVGVIERVRGHGMDVICGAGVGGGSLVYDGILIPPPRDVFKQIFEACKHDCGEAAGPGFEQLIPHYKRAGRMMRIGQMPDDILNTYRYKSTRLFIEHTKQAGFPAELMHAAMDWDIVRDELAGRAVPSATVGEGIFGTDSSAKNSVDRNYLAQAEATGFVQTYILHVVDKIALAPDGTYLVMCDCIDEGGEIVSQKILACDYLFLAAGSTGTTNLLVKAKAKRDLDKLNEHVGKYWGNNGDRLFLRLGLKETTLSHQGGPACATAHDENNPLGLVGIEHGPAPLPIEAHAMALLGMGIPEGYGTFHYNEKKDRAVLHWPRNAEDKSVRAIKQTLHKLSRATGGVCIDMTMFGGNVTFHPLGGAILGKACDAFGRVRNYQRLYVVDGSLIPGSTGCSNPAWTVAALAEYAMEHIISNDF